MKLLNRQSKEETPQKKMDALERRTAEIEAEKLEKKQLREEKKFHKEQALHRKKMERVVAPVLLLLTVAISIVILILKN